MVSVLPFKLALLGCVIASASVLNVTSPITLQQVVNTINTLMLPNGLQSDNKVINLTLNARCNGPGSGVGLTKESCQDAVTRGIPFVTASAMLTYGDRSIGNFDINLPQRYISGQ